LSDLEAQVEQIVAAIKELREVADDGPRSRKLLESLFRHIHNFKSRALTEGRSDAAARAHECENLLHAVRIGKVKLGDDVFRRLDNIGEELIDGKNIASDAGAATEGRSYNEAQALVETVPTEMWDTLTEAERHRVVEAMREGATVYVVEAKFAATDFDRKFQELKERLNKSGEVIATAPKLETDYTVNFRVLYSTTDPVSPVARLFHNAVRAGQAAASILGKEIDFLVRGVDVQLAESLCNALGDPLMHLVRNAVDHGVENADERVRRGKNLRGKIVIEATAAQITVTDDGRGIDPAIVPLLFQPGFTTATDVSMLSGRGVGLDVVATTVKDLGGSIEVSSQPGKGSTFTIKLPS